MGLKKNYYTLGQVAQILGIANNTIKRWYQWYEQDELQTDLVLPKYLHFDKRGTKFFRKDSLEMFRKFQSEINKGGSHYGVMAEFNVKNNNKKRGE